MSQTQMNISRPKRVNKGQISALLSILFMGMGQIYNRQYIKGILYFLVEWYVILFFSKTIVHGLWGLYTLGEQPQIVKGILVVHQGDHSIFLMIEGILTMFLIIIFLLIYVQNVRDAYQTGLQRELGKKVRTFKESLLHIWENGFPYVLITPTGILIVFIVLFPLVFGILIAFTNYSSPDHLPPRNLVDWVGFESFAILFKLKTWSKTFYGVFSWTVIWALLSTISVMFTGLIVAVLINSKFVRYKGMWRTIIIIPWAIPQYVSLLIFRNLYNGQFGPINNMLVSMGFERIPWLSDPLWAKISILMANLWTGFPFWMAYMAAILLNIDRELYEAAEVDGAGPFQKFSRITLPAVLSTTAPLFIFTFAFNFNNFNVIYLLTDGNPANVNYNYAGHTDILISWLYKLTLSHGQFNMASVVSIVIFIIIAGISIWNLRKTNIFKEVS